MAIIKWFGPDGVTYTAPDGTTFFEPYPPPVDEDCTDGLHGYCLTCGCTCPCHSDQPCSPS